MKYKAIAKIYKHTYTYFFKAVLFSKIKKNAFF